MPEPPAPAAYFDHPDAALRLRFWFGGHLRDEVWLDAADPESDPLAESVSAYHMRLTRLADAAGVVWMVEVYDPGAPPGRAYHRYGTDVAGMVAPAPRRPDQSGPLRKLGGEP
jgi:hypothetical protein